MSRRKAPTGESESLNGLLDTMTNVIGVLILMLLASFLSVKEVTRIVEKKSAMFTRTKGEQVSEMRMEAATLDQSLAALRSEAANLAVPVFIENEREATASAREALNRGNGMAGELVGLEPQTMLADLRTAQARLALLQEEAALQERTLSDLRRSSVGSAAPKPKTKIARVPDPVPAPKDSEGNVILCRYGRVLLYNEKRMEAALREAFNTATGGGNAKSMTALELYRKVQAYFDANEVGGDGLRWRMSVEYDSEEATARGYVQLRASVEWVRESLGETLEQIQQKGSGYQGLLRSLSPRANYLKFLVWPDSFAEYAVAREIADSFQFSSGWIPQQGGGMDVVMARTVQKTQSPLEVPRVAQRPQYHGPGLVHIGLGGGGGGGAAPSFGGGGGGGAVGGGGGGVSHVD
ncbi:MAG TPA: hypothetical protein P5205_08240 [Candidatus Paceibacterota bacterium]|nr:hypothetical protein [Verrucomicrobiota bacterium]HSA10348.1 hypothetical protein [Candidatus Paceibacterota bacterium]